MAYFGGTVSQRAFPRFNFRFIALFCLASAGVVASVMMGRDLLAARQAAIIGTASGSNTVMVNPVVIAEPKKIAVYIANEAIPAGKRLTPSMFRLDYQKLEGLEDKVIGSIADFDGQYARVAITTDTPLFRESVAAGGGNNNIIAQIPNGYRAVAIPVNVVTGVEGWVQPGARVDVVWSTEERGNAVVTTLVENAQVLSAERSMEPLVHEGTGPATVPSHISLLVTTKDAQKIQLAKNSGSLSLSLRGQEDLQASGSDTLRADSLLRGRSDQGDNIQGTVKFDGQEFVFQAGALISKDEYERKMKEASKQ